MTAEDLTTELPVLINAEHRFVPQLASERWPEPSVDPIHATRFTWEHESKEAWSADRLHWTIKPPLSDPNAWNDFVTSTSEPETVEYRTAATPPRGVPLARLLPEPVEDRMATFEEMMLIERQRVARDQAVPRWPSYVLTLLTGVAAGVVLGARLLGVC